MLVTVNFFAIDVRTEQKKACDVRQDPLIKNISEEINEITAAMRRILCGMALPHQKVEFVAAAKRIFYGLLFALRTSRRAPDK